jgi:hypothetical protein
VLPPSVLNATLKYAMADVSPETLHVTDWLMPAVHDSPPLGEVTVIVGAATGAT